MTLVPWLCLVTIQPESSDTFRSGSFIILKSDNNQCGRALSVCLYSCSSALSTEFKPTPGGVRQIISMQHSAPSLCVSACVEVVFTGRSQHRSHQSESAASGKSLFVFQVVSGCQSGKGCAGVWTGNRSQRCPTPPGCWPGAWVGEAAGVAVRPRGWGSSRSDQVRGDRRSSGAEWCWGTVVEQVTCLISHKHSVTSLFGTPR